MTDVQYVVLMGPQYRCFKIYTLKIHLNFSVQNRLNKSNKSGGFNVIFVSGPEETQRNACLSVLTLTFPRHMLAFRLPP